MLIYELMTKHLFNVQPFCRCCFITIYCISYFNIFSICNEFQAIKQRALKIPEDTREMTDMMKFIKDAKTARLVKLNEQIKVSDF